MKIVKYIFVLFILATLAFSVFVATQPSEFKVYRSLEIPVEQATVFNYVNEYKNWQDWSVWEKEDSDVAYKFPLQTSGKGAFYTWEGEDTFGKVETKDIIATDSILQKITFQGEKQSDGFWAFKPTPKGTLVTWGISGKLDFMWKMHAVLNGGVEAMFAPMFKQGLKDINHNLVYELKTYSVQFKGLITTDTTYFYKKTWYTSIPKFEKKSEQALKEILELKEKKGITTSGKPFIIFDLWDLETKMVTFSVGLPVAKPITEPISEWVPDMLLPYLAYKTVLKGNYTHRRVAWNKSFNQLAKLKWQVNTKGKLIEIYSKTRTETRKPSELVTEILIPVRPKVVRRTYTSAPISSESTPIETVTTPTENP